MPLLKKQKILLLSFLILLFSVACNLPYGIGLESPQEIVDAVSSAAEEAVQVAQGGDALPTPDGPRAPTPTATYLPTFTPTTTPYPTPTATKVVPEGSFQESNTAKLIEGTPVTVIGEPQVATGPAPVSVSNRPQAIAGSENVIYNGDFEAEWPEWQGVAPGWHSFDNGEAHFSWYNDKWYKVVYQGEQAQLIEIVNDGGKVYRAGGIYQSVNVVPWAEYELTIHALLRSDEGNEEDSEFGYAMEYGIDYYGGDNWEFVHEWTPMPLPEYPRQDPKDEHTYEYSVFTTRIIPVSDKLTLFIRGNKKWPNYSEGNFDIDAVSLRGTGKPPSYAPTPAPGPPIVMLPTPIPRCSPYQWSPCGGVWPDKVCPAEHVVQCRSDGTWGECVWDPGSCAPTPVPPTATPDPNATATPTATATR